MSVTAAWHHTLAVRVWCSLLPSLVYRHWCNLLQATGPSHHTSLVVVRLAWFLFDVRYSSVLACCRQLVLLVGVVFVVPIVVDSPK